MRRNKKNNKSKIWGGRFTSPTDKVMVIFNASIDFDKKLYLQDIEGSLAHAEMLAKQKIILKKDFIEIKSGLLKIKKEIENNTFKFDEAIAGTIVYIPKLKNIGKILHTPKKQNKILIESNGIKLIFEKV